MTTTLKDCLRFSAEWFIVAFLSGVCTLFAWWIWGPYNPPYIVAHPELHRIIVVNNDRLLVTRAFRSMRDDEIKARREIKGVDLKGNRWIMPLPTSEGRHPAGDYIQTIPVDIPAGLPAGHYEYYSIILWKDNPIRWGHINLPVLKFDLTEESK